MRAVGRAGAVGPRAEQLTDHLKENEDIAPEFRLELAREAFLFSASYEARIAGYLEHVAPVDAQTQTSTVADSPSEILPKQLTLAEDNADAAASTETDSGS